MKPPTMTAGLPPMMAIVQDEYGPAPEVVLRVEEIDRPVIGEDEVLVRVHAASVDRGTWHVMAGLPYPIRLAGFGLRRPKYRNPGRNLAGTVEVVGTSVTAFNPGDAVFGIGEASFAEYARARPDKLAPKPAKLSLDQAAAVPVSALAALQAVRDHGRVQAGQQVSVPTAEGDSVVTMSFVPSQPNLAVRLGRLVDKSFHPLTVTADGTRFRLPRALADGPLVVNLPLSTGWPAGYGGGTDYRTVSFSEPGQVRFSIIKLG